MFIILPLALIGVGFMVYLLFAAATYVLPLYAGLSVGFAALHAGSSYPGAMRIGIIAFLLVIAIGHMATRLVRNRQAQIAIALIFVAPASIAGFQAASVLLHLGGGGSWGLALSLAAAMATGAVAAKRHRGLPHA